MIFLFLILIPIIEISIFISIGSKIGTLNTISIILLTAIIGIFFLRRKSFSLIFNAQENLKNGIFPTIYWENKRRSHILYILVENYKNFGFLNELLLKRKYMPVSISQGFEPGNGWGAYAVFKQF